MVWKACFLQARHWSGLPSSSQAHTHTTQTHFCTLRLTCQEHTATQPATLACKMEVAVWTRTRCTHVFGALGADSHALGRCLVAKFLRRSSGGTLLRVHCWLGRLVCVRADLSLSLSLPLFPTHLLYVPVLPLSFENPGTEQRQTGHAYRLDGLQENGRDTWS